MLDSRPNLNYNHMTARDPHVRLALAMCEARGHKPLAEERWLCFSESDTTVDDVLWMRDSLPELDRYTIRLCPAKNSKRRRKQ